MLINQSKINSNSAISYNPVVKICDTLNNKKGGSHLIKEIRTVKFDSELEIEAYHFEGIMQKFPNHFHEYYVIGFIENGSRYLSCKNRDYTIESGDLLLFNPGDNHTCEQIDDNALDYRCINIQPEIMSKAAYEIAGRDDIPYFTTQVVFHSDLVKLLKELHLMIMYAPLPNKKVLHPTAIWKQFALTELKSSWNRGCCRLMQHCRRGLRIRAILQISSRN